MVVWFIGQQKVFFAKELILAKNFLVNDKITASYQKNFSLKALTQMSQTTTMNFEKWQWQIQG